jgi:glycine cleavage system H protein
MAFVSPKPVGTKLAPGDEFAAFETVKTNVSLYTPVAGPVVEVNTALAGTPEVVNQDPYERGWLAVIETTDWDEDRTKLLDPHAYLTVMRAQIERELERS